MTAQRTKFVAGVLKGQTLKAAYVAAGYAGRGHSAEAAAERLSKVPEVAAAIAAGTATATAAAVEQAALDKHWVLTRLMTLATAAQTDAARIKALELLGSHLSLWVSVVQERPPLIDLTALSDTDKAKLLHALRAARAEPRGG